MVPVLYTVVNCYTLLYLPRFMGLNITRVDQLVCDEMKQNHVILFQSKIVRVLNLWQKNSVFKSDIIQPLLDMAAGLPPPSIIPVPASTAVPVNNATPG